MHRNPPPPCSRAPGLRPVPSHCLPDSLWQLEGHFITDSNRSRLLWQPTGTACLNASGAVCEVPSFPVSCILGVTQPEPTWLCHITTGCNAPHDAVYLQSVLVLEPLPVALR